VPKPLRRWVASTFLPLPDPGKIHGME
jgi:hypothetical protein